MSSHTPLSSNAFSQPPPKDPESYIHYRRLSIEDEMTLLHAELVCRKEAFESAKTDDGDKTITLGNIESTRQHIKDLQKEQLGLDMQGTFLVQDLNDINVDAAQAYINHLYELTLKASAGKFESPKKKPKDARMDRTPIREESLEYYTGKSRSQVFCHVVGKWCHRSWVKCAHIVPHSFDSEELSYLFGVGEAALTSSRNTLLLSRQIEEAFDGHRLTFVPVDVAATPVEWKLVVLDQRLLDDDDEDGLNLTGLSNGPKTWKELGGKQLTFCNENRPARRYLYFRYAMAKMWVQENSTIGLADKLPSTQIWAKPGKKETGYLRRSALKAMAKMVGDFDVDTFADEQTTFEDTDPTTASHLGIRKRRCKSRAVCGPSWTGS